LLIFKKYAILVDSGEFFPTGRALSYLMKPFVEKGFGTQYILYMRKAIGFVIVLWALSHFLSQTFTAMNSAAAQSFKTLEAAAILAEENLTNK